MRETNTPPKTAQVSPGFSLLESPVRRSHYIYTHISLISKDAPIHTETQLLVKPPNILGGSQVLINILGLLAAATPAGTPSGPCCACCQHSYQVGPLCISLRWLILEPPFIPGLVEA